jgi:hypothetical protein
MILLNICKSHKSFYIAEYYRRLRISNFINIRDAMNRRLYTLHKTLFCEHVRAGHDPPFWPPGRSQTVPYTGIYISIIKFILCRRRDDRLRQGFGRSGIGVSTPDTENYSVHMYGRVMTRPFGPRDGHRPSPTRASIFQLSNLSFAGDAMTAFAKASVAQESASLHLARKTIL